MKQLLSSDGMRRYERKIFASKIGDETPDSFDAFVPDDGYIKNLIPKKSDDSHKGDFGRLLVIAGSVGMTGAAYLSCMGALRSGCGLVTLAIPQNLNSVMEIKLTEAMTVPLDCCDKITYAAASKVLKDINRYNAVVIGPGLGASTDVSDIISDILKSGVPAVIDADGINSIAPNINILRDGVSPVLITPHPGEFSRITGKPISEIQKNRLTLAKEFASQYNTVIALKGASTVVATPGGESMINPTGNRGMATGGSGDVLSGIAGAFMAQGMTAKDAACAAVYVHGAAGDIAALRQGKISLIASDICDSLPMAFKRIMGE